MLLENKIMQNKLSLFLSPLKRNKIYKNCSFIYYNDLVDLF